MIRRAVIQRVRDGHGFDLQTSTYQAADTARWGMGAAERLPHHLTETVRDAVSCDPSGGIVERTYPRAAISAWTRASGPGPAVW